jgi:hypothetical protein
MVSQSGVREMSLTKPDVLDQPSMDTEKPKPSGRFPEIARNGVAADAG